MVFELGNIVECLHNRTLNPMGMAWLCVNIPRDPALLGDCFAELHNSFGLMVFNLNQSVVP